MAPSYAWFYEDPFHIIYLSSTTGLSLLSNGLLLFVICTTKSVGIGSYRYLLAIFAVCDIITSLGHAALQPMIHMTDSSTTLFPRHGGIMIAGYSYDTLFCLIFIATYFQTFLILSYHFVYRYKTVTGGFTRSFTDLWTPTKWISLGIAVNILYITGVLGTCVVVFVPSNETRPIVSMQIFEIYGMDLRNPNRGYTTIMARRPHPGSGEMLIHVPSAAALIILSSLFGATASAIVYCIWKINSFMKSPGAQLTPKTRQMQMDLFRALQIQSVVPVLFSYLPLATILVFPAAGISLGAFGNILLSITAIFPAIDAFFVLFFIRKFWDAVIRLLRLPFSARVAPNSS